VTILIKSASISKKMSKFATLLYSIEAMNEKVLIIGNHPINADLIRQYSQRGDEVVSLTSSQAIGKTDIATYKEFALLANWDENPFEADNKVMNILQQIAVNAPDPITGKRPLCHLLLRSHSLLHVIRLDGFRKEIEGKLEVNPFTMEDQWSQIIAMGLDREPITKQSEKTVHLVIFGMSEIAEQVAINAAHVCHYPNYLQKNHSLRTRITVIDDAAFEKSREWVQRYKNLFDNSYFRFVDTKKNPAVTNTYRPMFKDREDFVDVEWEFVEASPFDKLVRNKISKWSTSASQLLTIVFADDNTDIGLSNALHLPEAIISAQIPVYVYMQSNKAFDQIKHTNNTPNIIPFGMADQGYDVNVPIVKMAKNVNFIYDRCYEENDKDWNGRLRFTVEIDEEKKEQSWAKKTGVKRMSNIYNAMTIGVKMRSMGFKENDWDKFYEISQEDMEILAEVEHNRWSVEELILGWRPCSDKEQREVEADINLKEEFKKRKIHYDLRAYNDLRSDGTGRPVQVYDRCLSACIPLIAKESKGGEA
jgi:hypothetical protein